MSEQVFAVVIAVALVIGFCKLVWRALDWLVIFCARRKVIRRRLGLLSARTGKRRIFGPGPGAACGDDAVDRVDDDPGRAVWGQVIAFPGPGR